MSTLRKADQGNRQDGHVSGLRVHVVEQAPRRQSVEAPARAAPSHPAQGAYHLGEDAMTERLGDAPIEETYRDTMNAVAGALDEAFNGVAKGKERKVGFILMVFPFGADDGRVNYISNGASRADIVTMLKEQIARFEGQPDQTGNA
jgi:hypothetical protein